MKLIEDETVMITANFFKLRFEGGLFIIGHLNDVPSAIFLGDQQGYPQGVRTAGGQGVFVNRDPRSPISYTGNDRMPSIRILLVSVNPAFRLFLLLAFAGQVYSIAAYQEHQTANDQIGKGYHFCVYHGRNLIPIQHFVNVTTETFNPNE